MTSLDKLITAYQEEDPQPRNSQLVTDEEADAAFIRFRNTFWMIIFFTLLTASILLPGVIGE